MVQLDARSRQRLDLVYPDIKVRYIKVYDEYRETHGKFLKVSSGLRTHKVQAHLYAKGRTKPGKIVTNSKPGWSFHQYGLAIDSFFSGKDPYLENDPRFEYWWKEYGRIAEKHGFLWGGHFSGLLDRAHVQLSYGLTITELVDMYKNNGLNSIWKYIDQQTQ